MCRAGAMDCGYVPALQFRDKQMKHAWIIRRRVQWISVPAVYSAEIQEETELDNERKSLPMVALQGDDDSAGNGRAL